MFNSLEELSRGNGARREYLGSDVYRAGYWRNVEKIQQYHRVNTFAVNSAHTLVRLLNALPINYETSVRDYYNEISDIAYDLASGLLITNPLNVGRVHKPWLFGEGFDEIPLAFHKYIFDVVPPTLENGFGTIQQPPVRLLRHPRSDLAVQVPMGDSDCTEKGLVIYSINIPLLAVQYREFKRVWKNGNGGDTLGAMHFIPKFILPALLGDFCNLSFVNRISKRLMGEQVGESYWRNPVGLGDFTTRLDSLIDEVVEFVSGRRMSYRDLMASIPLLQPGLCLADLFAIQPLTGVYETRQVVWATVLAELPIVALLMNLDYLMDENGTLNKGINNQIQRELTYAKNNGTFRQIFDSTVILNYSKEISLLLG